MTLSTGLKRILDTGFRPGGLLILPALVLLAPTRPTWALASMLIMTLGLIDDLCDLRPAPKLIWESAMALLVVGPTWKALWLVFMTNAMNLSDNMDGLAIGLGWIASMVFGAKALAWCLTGPLLVFWLTARLPRALWLGDMGALPLGFVLGLFAMEHSSAWPLAVPIADTCFVAVARPLSHRSPFKGGRDHLSHRLARRAGTGYLAEACAVAALLLVQMLLIAWRSLS